MMAFQSSTIVQRKLESEFDENAPEKDCIIATLQRFFETSTVENWERSRPSKIAEEKIDEVHDTTENQQQINIRTVATVCSISRTTTHRIMIEYPSLKSYKTQLVQKFDEEAVQDSVDMCKILIAMLEDNDTEENFFSTK